ncbi:MAG: hypothetical protein IKC46_09240, partial [Lachnospiraceae bacterium]|nr:hypothetical protein [Lachnospiraceae bacterium]
MKRRKIISGVLVLIGSLFFSMQAFGYWIEDENGWKYLRPDGSYIVESLEWIDGNFDGFAEMYCFDENGYCLQGEMKHGRTFNEDGAWVYRGEVQSWNLKNLTGWYRLNGERMYLEEEGNIWRGRITPDNLYVDHLGWKVTNSGIDEAMMAEKSKDCCY